MRRALSWLLLACALLAGGCASLPPPQGRTPSYAIQDTADTLLGRDVAPLVAAHPGQSGIAVLEDPYDAFAARVLMANAAERSLDAQYFIWHADAVGL